jgi:hypothetical protein
MTPKVPYLAAIIEKLDSVKPTDLLHMNRCLLFMCALLQTVTLTPAFSSQKHSERLTATYHSR